MILDVMQTSSHQIWLCAHQAKNLFTRKLVNIQTISGCCHYCFWNLRVQGLSCHFFSLVDLFTSFPPTSEYILYQFWRNSQFYASTFFMLAAVLLISILDELYNFLIHALVVYLYQCLLCNNILSWYGILHEFFTSLRKLRQYMIYIYTADMEENQNIKQVLNNENKDFRLFVIDKICLETITDNLGHHI